MSRPEDSLPPDLYYNDTISRSYTTSSRIQHIQAQMSHRCISLLGLSSPSLILDVGCGSGLSGSILSDPSSHPPAPHHEEGHTAPQIPHEWVGLDISAAMLSIAAFERTVTGDLLLADMGSGLPFRAGSFDGCISVSAIQWLCAAPSSLESEQPARRLKRFFDSLFVVLRRGARAVCQFYPKDASQRGMIAQAAVKAGFGVGLLEDDGGTKNAKTYLVCSVGGGDISGVVKGMGVDVEDGRRSGNERRGDRGKKGGKGSKEWILRKKDQAERKGKIVKADSRYTGRKRKAQF